MSNREVDNVMQDMRSLRPNSDFSHVAGEIADMQKHDSSHFQRNIAELNKSINMKDLGFPEDFQIVGVNDHGKVMTVSEDGSKVQQRDAHHMHVEATFKNTEATQRWGNRDVVTSGADGSGKYTVKPQDTLWSIATDSLYHQLGHPPTKSEVAGAVKDIASENNISDPSKIRPGQEIHLSARPTDTNLAQRADVVYQPTLPANASEMPDNGVLKPLAVPGFGSHPSENVDSKIIPQTNGTTKIDYHGDLNDHLLFSTKYDSSLTTDKDGRLLHSSVDYSGRGTDLTYDTGGSCQTLKHVQRAETTFDSKSGNYETKISTADGSQYKATTNSDGKVTSFKQQQAAYEPTYVPIY